MLEKPRKGFDILEVAEEIHRKQHTLQPYKEYVDLIHSQWIATLRMQRRFYVSRDLVSTIWRDLLVKTRKYPKPEFIDDITELRQEVNTLKLMIKSLTKNLESSNKTIDKLSQEIRQKQTIDQKVETSLARLCDAYVEMVSNIEIVKKIYVVDTNNGLLCWTIVDAEPFDSTLLEPIYDAQVKIYKEIEEDLELDFHVLNLSELHDRRQLNNVLPPSARLIWER